MITDARDIAAMIDYGKRLIALREEHLNRILNRQAIPGNYWTDGEKAALDGIRKRYYCVDNRLLYMPREQAKAVNDEQDFDSRCTKLGEALTFETHKKIKAIPYVGDPHFNDA